MALTKKKPELNLGDVDEVSYILGILNRNEGTGDFLNIGISMLCG